MLTEQADTSTNAFSMIRRCDLSLRSISLPIQSDDLGEDLAFVYISRSYFIRSVPLQHSANFITLEKLCS